MVTRTRLARVARGWTQRQLSQATGIALSRLTQIECWGWQPSRDEIKRLAQALDLQPVWFERGPMKTWRPLCPKWRALAARTGGA